MAFKIQLKIVTDNLIYQQENIFASSNLGNMTAQDIGQYFCDSMKKMH